MPNEPGKAAKRPRALIIAGPTCSGKSALAMEIAERWRGIVINADSMQIYRELRILTARPTPQDEARVPHALYGVRSAAEKSTAAWWRRAALAAMEQAHESGYLPILCGGTGMYFRALTEGLTDVPDPGEMARDEARALLAELGPEALRRKLAEVDPDTAARIRPQDSQRIARAYEVWRGTGRGLAYWHKGASQEPAPWDFRAILIDPPRTELRRAIVERFNAMVAQGAVEEVRALRAMNLDRSHPAMRAHGVPELMLCLDLPSALSYAVKRACELTAQYTKRQATWFRHQPLAPAMRKVVARFNSFEQFCEEDIADLQNFLLNRD